jgi:hypothetical protein
VEREEYRSLVRQMFVVAQQLEGLPMLTLEIIARRRGTDREYRTAQALRIAQDALPKRPEPS